MLCDLPKVRNLVQHRLGSNPLLGSRTHTLPLLTLWLIKKKKKSLNGGNRSLESSTRIWGLSEWRSDSWIEKSRGRETARVEARKMVCWAEPQRETKMRGSQREDQGTSSPIPWCTPYSQQPYVCNKVGKSESKDTRKNFRFMEITGPHPITLQKCSRQRFSLNLNGQSRIRHMRNMTT